MEDRRQLVKNKAWREFREWVKATVEMEASRTTDHLETYKFDEQRVRRDAVEDVWAMVLSFEKEGMS